VPTYICTYPKNLVKIAPVHSEIIGFHGTDKTVFDFISPLIFSFLGHALD